jgi:hypothetical protein
MNDDMPWVDLTPEEVQELRTKKQELTEYGKQKIRELMSDGKLRLYDKGKETFAVEDPYWGGCKSPETQLHIKEMTHEEMLQIAERRELINEALEELTREERIKLALEEVDWIVIGGQDGEEFYGSIQFIRKVLKSLV